MFGQKIVRTEDSLSIAIDKYSNIITFQKKSTKLTNEGIKELEELILLKKEGKFDENERLIIFAVTDKSEYKKDRFIGMKRCKVVMDYIENEINSSYFIFITSEDVSPFNSKIKSGVFYTFSTFKF
jgi:hypothetical protein